MLLFFIFLAGMKCYLYLDFANFSLFVEDFGRDEEFWSEAEWTNLYLFT